MHALPLTKIKIDRSFVAGLHRNSASYKIVKSLIALSRDMNLDCVVEGVETQEELDVLLQLGGDLVQGYYYSPPVEPEVASRFLGAAAGTQAHVGRPQQASAACCAGARVMT